MITMNNIDPGYPGGSYFYTHTLIYWVKGYVIHTMKL